LFGKLRAANPIMALSRTIMNHTMVILNQLKYLHLISVKRPLLCPRQYQMVTSVCESCIPPLLYVHEIDIRSTNCCVVQVSDLSDGECCFVFSPEHLLYILLFLMDIAARICCSGIIFILFRSCFVCPNTLYALSDVSSSWATIDKTGGCKIFYKIQNSKSVIFSYI